MEDKTVQAVRQALAARYGLPVALLAAVSRAAPPRVADSASWQESLRRLWAAEAGTLRSLPLPGPDYPPFASLATMSGVATFLGHLTTPCPLDAALQRQTALYFQQAIIAPRLPLPPEQAGPLCLLVNAQGQPAVGVLVVARGGTFYVAYGPDPDSRAGDLTSHASGLEAMMHAGHRLEQVQRDWPTLSRAGTIDYAASTGCAALPLACPQCGASLVYGLPCFCQRQEQTSDRPSAARFEGSFPSEVIAALAARGIPPLLARQVWQQGSQQAGISLPLADTVVRWREDTQALAALLAVTAPLPTDPPTLAACSNLLALTTWGPEKRSSLEQDCYLFLLLRNPGAAVLPAQQHDELAERIGHPLRLLPLVQAAPALAGPAARMVAFLLPAKAGQIEKAAATLRGYLARPDLPSQLAAIKALQVLSGRGDSNVAGLALVEALEHGDSRVRLAATLALQAIVVQGHVPPLTRLAQMAQSDWNPFVRQASRDTLAYVGAPLCPACGKLLEPGAYHECRPDPSFVLDDLVDQYLRSLPFGPREPVLRGMYNALCLALDHSDWQLPPAQRRGGPTAVLAPKDPATLVRLLTEADAPPLQLAQALLGVTACGDGSLAAACVPHLYSDLLPLALLATQALVAGGETGASRPDLPAALLANAMTLARQGRLDMALLSLPAWPLAPWTTADYADLAAFASTAWCCPACGASGPGEHVCPAPTEVRLAVLADLEAMLATPEVRAHPLGHAALLRAYNAVAFSLGTPPHPFNPVPPAPAALPPLVARLLAAVADSDWDTWDEITPLLLVPPTPVAGLALAWALAAHPPAATTQHGQEALAAAGFVFCPHCGRFMPAAWPHACLVLTAAPDPEGSSPVVPPGWEPDYADPQVAMQEWGETLTGRLFLLAIQTEEDLAGAFFSALHLVVTAESGMPSENDLCPAAMLGQQEQQWFVVYGPVEGSIVIEEAVNAAAAYNAAVEFLQRHTAAGTEDTAT